MRQYVVFEAQDCTFPFEYVEGWCTILICKGNRLIGRKKDTSKPDWNIAVSVLDLVYVNRLFGGYKLRKFLQFALSSATGARFWVGRKV